MVTESDAVDIEETTKTKSTSTKSSGGQGADTSAMSGGAGAIPTESSSQSTASSKKVSSTEQGQTAPPAGETAEILFTAEQSTVGQEGSPSDTLTSVAAAASTASPSNAAAASSQALSDASNTSSATKTNAGALAGGIVGAFFGGAMLALVAAYLFNRRRKSLAYKGRGNKAVESVHGASNKRHLRPAMIVNAWERLIPQPVDDEKMGSLVKSLLDRVVLHVDNFYARKPLQISTADAEAFAKVDTKLLPCPLSEMMLDLNMQMLVIKHCIAFALTDSIMPGDDDPSNKILPIYLAALPRKLVPEPESENDLKAERQAYAVWRVLTSCLLPKLADEPMLADQRRKVTKPIIGDLTAAFRNWEVSSDNGREQAAQNLEEIVGVAFDVGMRIASQACSFKFEKHQRRRRTDEPESFVVLPGFNKVVDERGNLIGVPQVLVRPTTYRPRRDSRER